MERQLSLAKRDQILLDEAGGGGNKSRKVLAESMLQSNQVFAQSMQAVSSSMMSIAQTMSRSFEVLLHVHALPEQGVTQLSFNAVTFMSQPPRLHEGHMGMISQSRHHSQTASCSLRYCCIAMLTIFRCSIILTAKIINRIGNKGFINVLFNLPALNFDFVLSKKFTGR